MSSSSLPCPLSSGVPIEQPRQAFSLNDDILGHIFDYLVDEGLGSPEAIQEMLVEAFKMTMFHPKPKKLETLRACTLVSRSWNLSSKRLLWHTIVVRMDAWETELRKLGASVDRGTLVSSEDGHFLERNWRHPHAHWVRRLILVGGGLRYLVQSNRQQQGRHEIWSAFPLVQQVDVVGLGWGTNGLIEPSWISPARVAPSREPSTPPLQEVPSSFSGIRLLDVSATPETMLRGVESGHNFYTLIRLLLHLPSLKTLYLREFSYVICASGESKTVCGCRPSEPVAPPPYALDTLELEKCSLPILALRWLIGRRSCKSMMSIMAKDCTFSDELDDAEMWSREWNSDSNEAYLECPRVTHREFDLVAQKFGLVSSPTEALSNSI